MHLQRAVPATQRDTPITITNNLNFLVTGGFDIELDQHVLVIANAGRFDLIENLSYQTWR